ncbi:hypothetical protein PAXRUDRAFT_166810, partial [Paxillus rubicundulus Ve08.2h10]
IEDPRFCQLILYCCPQNITDPDIPHHTKTYEVILNNFGMMFTVLQANLLMAMREMSFTADIWSSESLNPYLAVTAHWIGQDTETGMCKLSFKSTLIVLHYILGSYMGVEITRALLHLIDWAGICLDRVHAALLHHS